MDREQVAGESFKRLVLNFGTLKQGALCLLSDGDERLCLTAAALPPMLDVSLEACFATAVKDGLMGLTQPLSESRGRDEEGFQ